LFLYEIGMTSQDKDKIYWRAEVTTDYCSDKLSITYIPCEVLRHTPFGVRLKPRWRGDKARMVYHAAKKRWAWPSKYEALASLIARRECQVAILERQLARAKEDLRVAISARKRDIVQVKNPRTGRYTTIDRDAGVLLKHKQSDGPYKGIPIIYPAWEFPPDF
jgi:hypothetical protein